MKNQESKPKIVRKPKDKEPVEPEVPKPLGKVAQIEKMIV